MNEEIRRFSLRKLSVGLASVLVGISIFGASQTVKADTVADQNTSAVTSNAQSSDTQENKNAVKSTFSNDNQADNAKSKTTQTQENEPKQVQAENVQQDSVPEAQETTDNKDLGAEKGIVHTSPLQEPDNQSNTVTGKTVQHDALESGQKTQSFNLPKNSQKFNRKVLATNLIATPSVTNGGFDEATWGKLDVNDWHGSVQDGVYQLTGYTGDEIHIIVPNEADFEQAGRSTNGLQVGITRDTVQSLLTNYTPKTIAFSKTNDQKVKAIGTDWSHAFSKSVITNFDGSNLDVSGVTNMSNMFGDMFRDNRINDLSSLANWDTSKVTDMSNMFNNNEISDLRPLSNWDTSKVTDMSNMFYNNKINDLTPLTNWKTSNVTNMSGIFGGFEQQVIVNGVEVPVAGNTISDLAPLTNWDVSNVTDMSEMFEGNSISNLASLTNWKISNVTDMSSMFARNSISDLSPLTNWSVNNVTDMRGMFSDNKISDLTPLTNWDVSNVTNMGGMFGNSKREYMPDGSVVFIDGNKISDLAPLTNWDVSNVTNMSEMFEGNSISNLASLTNWNVSNVTNMSKMFARNSISDLTPLTNWDVGKVSNMRGMFAQNPDIKDLKPVANRDMRSVTVKNLDGIFVIKNLDGIFGGDAQLDLTNINNTQFMQDFVKLKEKVKNTYGLRNVFRKVLQDATFITNNADLVEVIMGKDMDQALPVFTNTATRTIVFNFPDGTSKKVTQHIYYKTIAPVQIGWFVPTGGSSAKMIRKAIRSVIRSAVHNPVAAIPRIIKTYTIEDVKASDWQLDTSKTDPKDAITVNGQVYFKPVPIPHVNGYKARVVKNPINPMMLMVSFMAVSAENKPSTPVEVAPSKPSATIDNPSKQSAPVDDISKPADDLQKHTATKLNSIDSVWTMPTDVSSSTYTVDVPVDNTIDLSDLVIAEPVHAQTRTQIHVTKRFKLSKKNIAKYLKHRKKAVRQFKKYRL